VLSINRLIYIYPPDKSADINRTSTDNHTTTVNGIARSGSRQTINEYRMCIFKTFAADITES